MSNPAPSTTTATYRLELVGTRAVMNEEGPLFASVDAERSMRNVEVKIRIVGHEGLYQRGVGARRTLQVGGFGEVRDGGLKIPAGYFEVHPKLKRQGLGALMMNAMLAWAHDYHPDAIILPIGVTHDAFASAHSPLPFYQRYGFRWTASADANKRYSYPCSVAQTFPLPLKSPTPVATIPLVLDPWRN